jgi:P-type conjugative transfer protein TrbG
LVTKSNLTHTKGRITMKRVIFLSTLAVMLSACASEHYQSQPFVQAQEMHKASSIIEVPSHNTNFRLIYGNDPGLERAFNQYARSGKAPNIVTDGFVKFAYNAGQQPVVKSTPFQETVISLQAGEKFSNVTSGDPSRWEIAAAVSGVGANQQQIILIKPSLPDIATNLVITTDKRIYNIRLISAMNSQPSRNVSFWYPDEMISSINNETYKKENDSAIASVPDVSLNNLNFNYRIASDGFFRPMPSWKPVRVFDDGSHTYIQFAADISNKDMPVLFVSNGGNKELINYRFKAPYFVVDKIFKEAVLVMGIGTNQSKVIVTNQYYS